MNAEIAGRCGVFGSIHVSCHHPSELPSLVGSVRALRKAGIDVGLNVLVSSATYAQLPGIWEWCAKHGISRLLLLKFKMTEINGDCRDMVLSADQEQSLLPLVRRLSRRHAIMPMLDCSFFPALAFSRPKRKDLEFFDVNGCVGGNAILAITTDGQFKPCSFYPVSYGDACLLNRKVWKESKELASFRQCRFSAGCGNCDYADLCNGGCRIAATEWC
jgi:radical SAM protein with 4Fe4S-binding SPASM domain